MENKILTEYDNLIENLRSIGLKDKQIALDLVTVAGLLKSKNWDDYYLKFKGV
jgi:hypothetical protein